MSELNIRIRKLQDNGSTFRATPETLYMGGVGSAKVDTLRFEVPEEWNGCAISLHVRRLSGALPDPQLLDENHCVVVDKRWTLEKQGSWMLLAMNDAGYIAMTKPGQYTCYETIDTNSTTETITKSIYEQFVEAVLRYANDALASKNTASEKAEEAKGHADRAGEYEEKTRQEMDQAGRYAEAAKESEKNAANSAANAKESEGTAKNYAESAKEVVEQNAKGYGGGYSRSFILTVGKRAWVKLDTPIGIYQYAADVEVQDCTAKWNAFAAVLPESYWIEYQARVANVIETNDGSVRLYAVNKPEGDMRFTVSVFAIGSRTYYLTALPDKWRRAENAVGANQWQCDISLEDASAEKVPMGMAALENTEEALKGFWTSPTMETFDGFIRIYAVKPPTAALNMIVLLLEKSECGNSGSLPEPGTPAWNAFITAANEALRIATDDEVDDMLDEIFS